MGETMTAIAGEKTSVIKKRMSCLEWPRIPVLITDTSFKE